MIWYIYIKGVLKLQREGDVSKDQEISSSSELRSRSRDKFKFKVKIKRYKKEVIRLFVFFVINL